MDLASLVAECRAALATERPQRDIREAVARVVSDRAAVLRALGEPTSAHIARLYNAPDLTILNVVWAPRMTLLPHDHAMWAVIGVYAGREDNIFWKRLPGDADGRIEAAGARSLSDRDVTILGPDIIHSVTNPIPKFTGAIHVYGGDFFTAARHEWDPETLVEGAFDIERNKRRFDDENRRFQAAATFSP